MEGYELGGGVVVTEDNLIKAMMKESNIDITKIDIRGWRNYIIKRTGTKLEDMPQEILVKILSFLPTKTVFRASILSKRWRYLWKSIRRIDFSQEGYIRYGCRFRNTLENFLLLRDSSNIQKFKISCSVENYEPHGLQNWLSIVVKHKVEELEVRLAFRRPRPVPYDLPSYFPSSLFTCESLTVLTLTLDRSVQDFNLPDQYQICFPCLRILTFRTLSLPGNTTERLLSGCPVLKELGFYYVTWRDIPVVRITSSSLESLSIFEDQCGFVRSGQVLILGENLKTFNYVGQLNTEYCFGAPSSLLHSSTIGIEMTDRLFLENEEDRPQVLSRHAHNLLRGLSGVRNLYLSTSIFAVLDNGCSKEVFNTTPTFSNLTFLQLDNIWDVNFASEALQNLLQRSPHLTSLLIKEGITLETSGKLEEWKLDPVPSCFLTHLEKIDIQTFYSHPAGLRVLEILRQHCPLLGDFIHRNSLTINYSSVSTSRKIA